MSNYLLNFIPEGKDHAVSRSTLRLVTGLKDRELRKGIEALRRDGHIVVNDQTGSGYYISNDIDDIQAWYWQNKKRALSLLYMLKAARQILRAAGRDV